jgi:hypothetical protein
MDVGISYLRVGEGRLSLKGLIETEKQSCFVFFHKWVYIERCRQHQNTICIKLSETIAAISFLRKDSDRVQLLPFNKSALPDF